MTAAVAYGIPEFLAQRREENYATQNPAVAHFSWSLHVWPGSCNSRDRAFREADFLANEAEPTKALS